MISRQLVIETRIPLTEKAWNSLRALVMQLDQLSPEEVVKLEIPTGVPICYQIDNQGKVMEKLLIDI